MKRITFEAGIDKMMGGDRKFHYFHYQDENILIYARCAVPEGASEDYGYMALKKAVEKWVADEGIGSLPFPYWYDGQEQYLSGDAFADCEVCLNCILYNDDYDDDDECQYYAYGNLSRKRSFLIARIPNGDLDNTHFYDVSIYDQKLKEVCDEEIGTAHCEWEPVVTMTFNTLPECYRYLAEYSEAESR